MRYKFSLFLALASVLCAAQNPQYGNEKAVSILGFTMDAMEPHLSTDGQAMFFNSLNDGITTSLYYAGRINDSTFSLAGQVPVVNQTITPRLDAVASLDTSNTLYWVSTRNWPSVTENLQRITFHSSSYSNFGRVYGDFYINSPGWIIMDAAISFYGDQLLFCNALFSNCGPVPCEARIGFANKVNDSTFLKIAPNNWLDNINDTAYRVYAPCLSADGLELFYTRLKTNSTQTEIMVSSRSSTNSAFALPTLLVGAPMLLPEAPTITADKSKMYYHRKVGNLFKLFYMERLNTSSLSAHEPSPIFRLYPNPATQKTYISNLRATDKVLAFDSMGRQANIAREGTELNLSGLTAGIYFVMVQSVSLYRFKLIKE